MNMGFNFELKSGYSSPFRKMFFLLNKNVILFSPFSIFFWGGGGRGGEGLKLNLQFRILLNKNVNKLFNRWSRSRPFLAALDSAKRGQLHTVTALQLALVFFISFPRNCCTERSEYSTRSTVNSVVLARLLLMVLSASRLMSCSAFSLQNSQSLARSGSGRLRTQLR